MSDGPAGDRARNAGTTPAPGWYPTPARHVDVVEREWDGDVWTDAVRPASTDVSIAPWHREPLRFLRTPGWVLLVVIVVGAGAAFAFVRVDDTRKWAEGAQWLAVPFAFAATVAVMLALLLFLDRRLRFGQVVHRWAPIVAWGVVSGLVAFAIALGLEEAIPRAFDSSLDKARGWYFIAGPVEEFAKVLVPVALWFAGRYRLPRQGLALVLLSAMTFGVLEGSEYAARSSRWSTQHVRWCRRTTWTTCRPRGGRSHRGRPDAPAG